MALVVTIIVLLILASVAISLTIGNNGIFTRAQDAVNKYEKASRNEEDEMKKATNFIDDYLNKNGGNNTGGTTVSEIFDETGQEEGKLHVGDFINYTAGNWTEEDMAKIENSGAKITANKSVDLPTEDFQFGGFEVGGSKDGNATPFTSPYFPQYTYVKDKETGEGVTGWRVFDVNDEGRVTLISAGCPEDYYIPRTTNNAYISEYILTENVNSNAESLDLGLGTTYLPRDWSMYENSKYGEVEAGVLTKKRLDEWYTKYITGGISADVNTDSTFRRIYKTDANVVNEGKYESLIDNYSDYWLCSVENGVGTVYFVYPTSRFVGHSIDSAYGVRVLVTLPSSTKVVEGGEKTVISRDNEYVYNVWNIKTN